MAISEDEALLYVMNLQNRTLYEINRVSGAAVRWQSMPGVPNVTGSVVNLSAASNLPPGSVSATNVRPFAVEIHNGKLYVGIIASAETTPSTLTNLQAHVYEVEPSTLAMTRRFSVTHRIIRGVIFSMLLAVRFRQPGTDGRRYLLSPDSWQPVWVLMRLGFRSRFWPVSHLMK